MVIVIVTQLFALNVFFISPAFPLAQSASSSTTSSLTSTDGTNTSFHIHNMENNHLVTSQNVLTEVETVKK